MLYKYDLQTEWLGQSSDLSKTQWDSNIDTLVRDNFIKNWKLDCATNKKLELYVKLGGIFGFKDYLNSNNIRSRDILARLRSGSNTLRIDTGRRLKITRNERSCKLCKTETEDAEHFLFNCPLLSNNREALKKILLSMDIENETCIKKTILGSGTDPLMNTLVLSYIHRMFNLRKKILREDSFVYLWGR